MPARRLHAPCRVAFRRFRCFSRQRGRVRPTTDRGRMTAGALPRTDSLDRVAPRDRELRALSAAARVVPRGRAVEGAALRGPGVLGPPGARLRRSRGAPADRRPGARRARRQPHRPRLHRRPLGRLPVRRAPPRRLRQPADVGRIATTASRCATATSRPPRAARRPRTSRRPRRWRTAASTCSGNGGCSPTCAAVLVLGKIALDALAGHAAGDRARAARRALRVRPRGVARPGRRRCGCSARTTRRSRTRSRASSRPADLDRVLADVRGHVRRKAGRDAKARRSRSSWSRRPPRRRCARARSASESLGRDVALRRGPSSVLRERGPALPGRLRAARPVRGQRPSGSAAAWPPCSRTDRRTGAVPDFIVVVVDGDNSFFVNSPNGATRTW